MVWKPRHDKIDLQFLSHLLEQLNVKSGANGSRNQTSDVYEDNDQGDQQEISNREKVQHSETGRRYQSFSVTVEFL